jgi:hypothetical protein
MARFSATASRHRRPTTPLHLWSWIKNHTGVNLAREHVCDEHCAPMDVMACWQFDRPPNCLLLGPRGGGKSFMTAIDSHLCSRFEARHGVRVLGGAKSQARQVLEGFDEAILSGEGALGSDKDAISKRQVEKIEYANGSKVEILTASPTSVRGPHVPTLRIDEVDEIEPELLEACVGMVMDKEEGRAGRPKNLMGPMISRTSTWHNLGGPMEGAIESSKAENEKRPGSYPFFTYCLFDVLRRCPDSLSGPNLEKCPQCPLMPYCHEDKESHGGVPKAKRADGHYSVVSALQKLSAVSRRTFEADYLCRGVRVEGLWFPEFSEANNVTAEAEYDPRLPVQFALDTGLRTAGAWFQVRQWIATTVNGQAYPEVEVTVFADYYAEHLTPGEHLRGSTDRSSHVGIIPLADKLCQGRFDQRWTDPAGRARNAIGSITLGEWEAAGMSFQNWPNLKVREGLGLLENLIKSADGRVRLKVHPRCRHVLHAFQTYRRKQLRGQWLDEPEDPQHPSEDLMDALRGGLVANFPEGRIPQLTFDRVQASKFF